MSPKLLTRDQFREGTFARDGHGCVVRVDGVRCSRAADDAHHIVERKLWGDGGYYIENGASVCEPHHMECEQTLIGCDELRVWCGIKTVLLPEHFEVDGSYDKWGNPILPNGQRMRGELFDDESVQKTLAPVLHLFTNRVKYPRTYHVPDSPGATSDDRVMSSLDFNRIFDAKDVVVTEKMDGECLASSTPITMADGSTRKLGAIVRAGPGALVLGVDSNGAVVPARVTRVYNNGQSDDWLRVTVRGNGTPARHIYCTPRHRFRTDKRRYTPAAKLRPGTIVELLRDDAGLTERQEQAILGMLLGDGTLQIHHGTTAMVQYSHKQAHAGYLRWIRNTIGHQYSGTCTDTSGFGSTMQKAWTVCTAAIHDAFASMIVRGKKTVPAWIIQKAGPIALAFWLMDDGSLLRSPLQRDRFQISVCGFNASSCRNLVALLKRFGVKATLHTWGGYRYLSVSADGSERLAELISPYVAPVMRYKLPEPWRSMSPLRMRPEPTARRLFTKSVRVLSVKRCHQNRGRYDIETSTHNYFAHRILVHNCTTLYRDYLHARSLEYQAHESRDWIRALHARIAHEIPETWRICGENLYARHSIAYRNLPSYFMVFSIWDGLRCLPWDETVEWCKMLDLHYVPTLYRGNDFPASVSWRRTNRGEEIEGWVVRLAGDFHYSAFRRSVAKYVRENHVQSGSHWMHGRVIPNGLAT